MSISMPASISVMLEILKGLGRRLVQKAIDFGYTQAQATYDQRCN